MKRDKNNPADEKRTAGKGNENSVMHSDFTKQDEQQDKDLPGYPHYPASEDLLNPENSEGKVDIDVENLSRSSRVSNLDFTGDDGMNSDSDVALPDSPALKDDEDDLGIVSGTEADVTEDDLLILGEKDRDMDMGEDEEIRSRSGFPLGTTGEDLDVPGSEMDDENESIGAEDEENNYYSLGGDNQDDDPETGN